MLSNRLPKEHTGDYDILIPYKTKNALQKAIDKFEQGESLKMLIYFEDVDYLFKQFSSFFSIVKAAGGLVSNPDGELLLIFRRGKWDLPKGKAEDNESIEQTAVREVSEETNLNDLKILNYINDTHHIYYVGNNPVLKQTRWYHLFNSGKDELIPQVKEDITDVLWVKQEDLPMYLKNTYGSITEVFRVAGYLKE